MQAVAASHASITFAVNNLKMIHPLQRHYLLEPGCWLPRPLFAHVATQDEPARRWIACQDNGLRTKKVLLGHLCNANAHFAQQNHIEHDWATEWRALELQIDKVEA